MGREEMSEDESKGRTPNVGSHPGFEILKDALVT